ncbi:MULTISPECIES: methyltransferase [Pseudovibrio]|uniref:methyltransferase n=1 Tax=Stappiaceae TaxID=2821832 RepID=UPI0023664B96|nr:MULTISPECIES: methyltransferase [Pseudovibrio]MDD7909922.1 methyltransferase [Pseudovibrio exalbescens]MDX5592259.1 methyltransferase [Pseudovibrio sp. SPO723]
MSDIENDALAEAYNRALELEKAGKLDEAAAAYAEVLRLDPADHGGAAVRLASMGRGSTPPKAPDAYVSTLFDQHAEVFDSVLVDQLGYSVPLQVRDRLDKIAPGPYQRMLDLGCGTGLTAEAVEDITEDRTGVDISEGMIEIADEKEVYDALYVSELVAFLQGIEAPQWHLVVATDVLPYMGALEEFFAGVSEHCAAQGMFAFSSETLPDEMFEGADYKVGGFQRFAHAETYVRKLLDQNGFETLESNPIIVRYEQGQPVPGHLYMAKKRG